VTVAASQASIHLLTPGSPAYALAKVGAIGGLVALRIVLSRRDRARQETPADTEVATGPVERRASAHPVSRRKKRRRRRG
jgi:hypothetical protein